MKYGLRFDFDGWMVIDATVVNGELAGEAVQRGLSFAEAEHLAKCLTPTAPEDAGRLTKCVADKMHGVQCAPSQDGGWSAT